MTERRPADDRRPRRRPDAGCAAGPAAAAADPMAMLRTRSYVQLLVLAALIGAPDLGRGLRLPQAGGLLQNWCFTSLPDELGFTGTPVWWPLPLLAVAGVLVGSTITYLPGTAGHKPAEGFKAGGAPTPAELPGVFLASLATLCLGVVLGPEAPLIAIGGGLGALAVHLAKKDAPPTAAVGHRLGRELRRHQHPAGLAHRRRLPADGGVRPRRPDPRPGARARPAGRRHRHPRLHRPRLAHRIRHLLPVHPGTPALQPTRRGRCSSGRIAFGLVASVLGTGIRLLGPGPPAGRRAPDGPAHAGGRTGRRRHGHRLRRGHRARSQPRCSSPVRSALPGLVLHASGWTVGALVLLVACKSARLRPLAVELPGRSRSSRPCSSGAPSGVAASHLPGLSLVPGGGAWASGPWPRSCSSCR